VVDVGEPEHSHDWDVDVPRAALESDEPDHAVRQHAERDTRIRELRAAAGDAGAAVDAAFLELPDVTDGYGAAAALDEPLVVDVAADAAAPLRAPVRIN
jgi:hypothetical protein